MGTAIAHRSRVYIGTAPCIVEQRTHRWSALGLRVQQLGNDLNVDTSKRSANDATKRHKIKQIRAPKQVRARMKQIRGTHNSTGADTATSGSADDVKPSRPNKRKGPVECCTAQ